MDRDNAISKARFEFRWLDQFNLSYDPDTVCHHHDNEEGHTCGDHGCGGHGEEHHHCGN